MMRQFLTAAWIAALLAASGDAQQQPAAHQHPDTPSQPSAAVAETADGLGEPAAKHETGPHGGSVQTVGGTRLETVVEPGGLRLFAYDTQGQTRDLRNVRGVATLTLNGVAKRYRYDLFPEVRQDQSAEALSARVDLRQIAGRRGELTFQLVGLAAGRRPVTFSTPLVGPMTEEQKAAAAIATQKICPVSGQPLGSMGEPIPVTVDGETVYVCCAGCVETVKADFATYQQKLAPPTELSFVPSTQADTKAIELQQTCPVAGAPLGSMGTPLKVTGLERDVFLCCEGCVEPLKNNPSKYLAKLPPLPDKKPEVVKTTAADAKYVAAQKICPVMEEPLDGMGGPYRTVVQGKVVYLCCPGCAKLLNAEPEKYFAKLAELGVVPPAAK